jgi:mRNA (guanine-N7-)-methyltransferase
MLQGVVSGAILFIHILFFLLFQSRTCSSNKIITYTALIHAAERARNIKRLQTIPCTFSCADLGADVPGQDKELLTWSLQNESDVDRLDKPVLKKRPGGGIRKNDLFDVVSVQFAIHYFMQTKVRARRFFKTVSQLLDEGGSLIITTTDARVIASHLMNLGLDLHFDESSDTSFMNDNVEISVGGGACRLVFEPEMVKRLFISTEEKGLHESRFGVEYSFQLIDGSDLEAGVGDAVNLEEWMTPIPLLVDLAAEVGLELVAAENFHEFYQRRSDSSTHPEAHELLSVMNVLNRRGTISPEVRIENSSTSSCLLHYQV